MKNWLLLAPCVCYTDQNWKCAYAPYLLFWCIEPKSKVNRPSPNIITKFDLSNWIPSTVIWITELHDTHFVIEIWNGVWIQKIFFWRIEPKSKVNRPSPNIIKKFDLWNWVPSTIIWVNETTRFLLLYWDLTWGVNIKKYCFDA